MSYFTDRALALQLPEATETTPGFRPAQLGAIHAAASHFTLHDVPGIITLPAGVGKTGVILALPFLLRAQRVLVVAPSKMLRDQLADGATGLGLFKKIGALPEAFLPPTVHCQRRRIATPEDWTKLGDYDIVVGTPSALSPALEGVPTPPADLFDLVLIDEAHHVAATTWSALANAFPESKRLLFTATPFRRDEKEIPGKLIYVFPLSRAFREGLFSPVSFVPVHETESQSETDAAIARAAEAVFQRDRAEGLMHHLMVRSDRVDRADDLMETYRKHTSLRLRVIKGSHSNQYVRRQLTALKDDQLDGVICVNVLSEGIDFPSLKIAAVHSPHKSLSATLQFVGRFVRTAEQLGGASFVACSDASLRFQAASLYEEGAVWSELIPDLLSKQLETEVETRELVQRFAPSPSAEDFADFSLYSLRPYFHVKVYGVKDGLSLDLEQVTTLPRPLQVRYSAWSAEDSALVVIGSQDIRPRWTHSDILDRSHSLFIVHYAQAQRLLFICSTVKSERLYQHIVQLSGSGDPCYELPLATIRRSLRGLRNYRFHSVGMRNRTSGAQSETYRTLTGSKSDAAIGVSDGLDYGLGHAFGSAEGDDGTITIGVSTRSKIWSNRLDRISELIKWCGALADALRDPAPVETLSHLDFLKVAVAATAVPDNLYAADWSELTYERPPRFQYGDESVSIELAMVAIELSAVSNESAELRLNFPHTSARITYQIEGTPLFTVEYEGEHEVQVCLGTESLDLEAYLNDYPLTFYAADGSMLYGREILPPGGSVPPLDVGNVIDLDWEGEDVDIKLEKPEAGQRRSIHEFVEAFLSKQCDLVINDDRAGEVADVVGFRLEAEQVAVTFVHCKKSHGKKPGTSVENLYEVLGQAQRSVRWTYRRTELVERLKQRVQGASSIVKGDKSLFDTLTGSALARSWSWRIVVAQPGLSISKANDNAKGMLAAASDHVRRGRCEPLEVWCSK